MAIEDANVHLRDILKKAKKGGPAAANAMAKVAYQNTSATLRAYSHPPGTPTPSPPGAPPALITGALRRSVKADRAVQAGGYSWKSRIYPTIVYARIQELGGNAGRRHASHLPPRPYLSPTIARLVANGFLTKAATRAFEEAVG